MNYVLFAVKAVIQRDDKFLIIKQKLFNKIVWDLSGGKVEYNESPYDVLICEVKEEIGLFIEIVKPIGFFVFLDLMEIR